MITKINKGAGKAARIWHPRDWQMIGTRESANKIMRGLSKQLGRELKLHLKGLPKFNDPAPITAALHLAIDNLSNAQAAIDFKLSSQSRLAPDTALTILDDQIVGSKVILQTEIVSDCVQASAVGNRTLNLLFCAKQTIKQRYSVITPSPLVEVSRSNGRSVGAFEADKILFSDRTGVSAVPRLVIPSSLLYQLHHSLFPAEKMMVAAGKRIGNTISVDAVFDVTGSASAGHVHADPTKLARALIAMSETNTYFAWWIHSHPSQGIGATTPSNIDRNQEIDWLNDYSTALVNAIMVEDRYIRFWGKAIDEKRIIVEINGAGINKEPGKEHIYRLET
jgi:hypothetical protein